MRRIGFALQFIILIIIFTGQISAYENFKVPPSNLHSRLEEKTNLLQIQFPFITTKFVSAGTFYISRNGSGQDGLTWESAWRDFYQIDWDLIGPGSIIYIDGGPSGMTYFSTLYVRKSGTEENPIQFKVSEESGRNGQVSMFGGRSIPLPYCGQQDYVYQTENVNGYGILFLGVTWIEIEGNDWSGITIFGHNLSGIRLYSDSANIRIRNVEIYDNGQAFEQSEGRGWRSNSPGVNLRGKNILFERVIIHDNGQDAFQSAGIDDFTLNQAWLHNERTHPIVDESFNFCTHTDGLQIFDGGISENIKITNSILGPGLTQGVILGQSETEVGSEVVVNDVLLRHVLFSKAADNNIMGYPDIKSKRWVIDHVTAHCPNTKGFCLFLEGSQHKVTDSIFFGGALNLPDGIGITARNCQWLIDFGSFTIGDEIDPLFVNISDDPFSLDNYTVGSASGCESLGSDITSVEQLLSLPN